ncbi:MAG TPA: hypothetical protein VHH88_01870 [Verrucomicrobiae bacterium]|nr:hypothetical protein [Verrucomicrobiae bacterium]
MALQTCPKCGNQFYGAACPDCDYPHPAPTASELRMQHLVHTRTYGVAVGLLLAVLSGVCFYAVYTTYFDRHGHWNGEIPFLSAWMHSQPKTWDMALFGLFVPWWVKDAGMLVAAFFACGCLYLSLGCFYLAIKPGAKKLR